ncbi:MAG TPA: PHB depolymerase family esterase [Microvirga sp.]|nr:PHB depolymerase family esterase [Microvirga sp.]
MALVSRLSLRTLQALAFLLGLAALALAQEKHTLEHDGHTRTFELHVPRGYDGSRPVPLVIALHPYPSDGARLRAMAGFDEKADEHGFLVAYPDGLNGGFNALICCGRADDVGFIRALIDRLGAKYAIDKRRIYATGISNGADLSYRLAAELPDVFAAIAPVSGGLGGEKVRQDPAGSVPKTPVSLIAFHGEWDQYLALFNRGLQIWREHVGCAPPETTPVDPGKTVTREHSRCRNGAEVVVYNLRDMSHAWPGGKPDGQLADPRTPIKATDLIWEFFASHPKLD